MIRFGKGWLARLLVVAMITLGSHHVAHAQSKLVLKDGDRVVFLGDGLIEQQQYSGWVELMLTASFPDSDVTFRNLGWSGDTPAGTSRTGLSLVQAGRESEDEGWGQLHKQLQLTQPTVLIIGYGMASMLENGQAGVDEFGQQYRRLLGSVREKFPQIRLVLITPIQPMTQQPDWSAAHQVYVDLIRNLGSEFSASVVDWSGDSLQQTVKHKDPIHLSSAGYRTAAAIMHRQLGLPESEWLTSLNAGQLRRVILRKNQWWFHRSRPANMAYVFGFRKHEQGQNAIEIPQFDPLIEREERTIAQLRSLDTASIEIPAEQLESQFAEFQAQPLPEFTGDEELEVTLWAQNPSLNKPIHMNWDAQGRLWVASSEAYPMIEVGQSPPDKIIMLEDTNGDGQADRSEVFADGLLIPTGIVPGEGGVYVAQSTDLLFLQDADGDGRADIKRRVLSGFGTEDTHHNLHTLRWGVDGRLYMNQSVYTRSHLETPQGLVRLLAGGGFRLDTETLKAEIFFRGLWNSWGHQVDAFNQSFLSDGAGFSGLAYAFPGATFNPSPTGRHRLDLISPGNWPKFCGLEVIEGNCFPPSWQHSLITCDFRANRVTRFRVAEQDAGFVTEAQPDLMRTSTATFRPIDAKVGPDGALYVADWSNPIINHGEVDFRDPRRDRWHGRIWRVRWKSAPEKQKIDYTQLNTLQLLNLLATNDRYDRDQARRVLLESGSEATAQVLPTWLNQQEGNDAAMLQGLWLQQALGIVDWGLLERLCTAKDANVRAAATRVLADLVPDSNHEAADPWLRIVQTRVSDPHPRVRLEAVRALGKLPSPRAATMAMKVLDQPMDKFLTHALQLTSVELAENVLSALKDGQLDWKDNQLEFFFTSIDPSLAKDYLARRFASQPFPADGQGPWIELAGSIGSPDDLQRLFDQAVDGQFSTAARADALRSLANAQRFRKTRPRQNLNRLQQLVQHEDSQVAIAAIELVGTWKLNRLADSLVEQLNDSQASDPVRLAALSSLRSLPPEAATTEAVLKIAKEDQTDPELRDAAIVTLAQWRPSEAVPLFWKRLLTTSGEEKALAWWRRGMKVKSFGQQLSAAIPEDLKPFQRQAGLRAVRDAGREEDQLARALSASPRSDAKLMTADEITKIAASVIKGDAARGESIYRRTELACVTCHAIGGVGGQVGPDLTSVGASTPIDYLVESIYLPDAKVKEGYHSIVVATDDGRLATGIEVESNEEEIVLRNAENQLVKIPKIEILDQRPGPSLMPTGVVERLSDEEQRDLLRFLSLLGKPGEYDATRGGVARALLLLPGTHRVEQQGLERIISGEAGGWKTVQTRVNGDLQRSVVDSLTAQPRNISLVNVYLKAKLELAQEGVVEFRVPENATLWVDGQPVESPNQDQAKFATPLKQGQHELLVRLDAREIPETIRVEASNGKFLVPDAAE